MRTVSQRELRNDNAAIFDAVVAGESFLITRSGKPAAMLLPHQPENLPGLPLRRAATARVGTVVPLRRKVSIATEDLMADLRGER